jgi:hypothetical protein
MKHIAVILLFAVVLLTACAEFSTRSSFDKTLEKYNEMVRWHDLNKAALLASPSIYAEYVKRVEDAGQAKIFDYQVVDVQYDEKTREASAVVIYSYFTYTTGEVRKVTDNQKWAYTSGNSGEGWRLQSPLPEFR